MIQWFDTIMQNPASAWITSGITFAMLLCSVALLRYVLMRYLSSLTQRTQTNIDDVVLVVIRKTHLVIVAVLAVFVAQKFLILPDKLTQLLRIAAIAGAFLQIGLWGNAIISFYLSDATRRASEQDINVSARRALAYLGRTVLWLLVLALLLENLGVRLTPLLAGIGIGGIAIALAIQNILGDLFCYVAIILDKPFIAGDFLIINDQMGWVERIGLKTTRIRSLSGELLIIANHDIVNSRVRNYKTLQERRIVFRFGVTYETPVAKLQMIPDMVRDVYAQKSGVRLDRVHFAQFGDFSLNFEVVYFVLSEDYNTYMDLQEQINLSLMQAFGKEGIEFAYPTQTLHIFARHQ